MGVGARQSEVNGGGGWGVAGLTKRFGEGGWDAQDTRRAFFKSWA